MKYHEESVEAEENVLPLKSSTSKSHQETLQSSTVASANGCDDNPTANRLSRSPVANTNGSASSSITSSNTSSNLKLCFSVRTVRIDHRSSQSLDRSKIQRRCPSPPPPSSSVNTLTGSTLHPSRSPASGVTSVAARAALRSRTSPSLLYERPGTASGVLNSPETVTNGITNSTAKVAIVSMQHSPVATTSSNSEQLEQIPSQSQLSTSQLQPPTSQLQPPQTPFNMCIYSNDVSELINTSGGAYTEPWCSGSSDRTAPVASLAPCSSSCCWPDDYEEFEQEKGVDEELECGVGDEADFLGEDCSSDLGFDSCYYPSRPTDSLPCLLHPTYPRHFHSPPPSFHHLLPRGSALDLSSTTTGMTEECSSCCWTADSSSLGYGRGGRHSSEDGGIPSGSFWTSPYPRVPPSRQRKQRLSSTSSALLVCRRRLSTNGGEKKNGVCSGSMRLRRGGDRHGRRRTMSSSGGSSGGILAPPAGHQHGMKADSVSMERSASVICGGGCDQTSMPMSKDELVTCPVHDCGLVCSGCENLCEHLKECHLPDSQSKPVRLIFACPVKSCRTFCANEAAFEAHFDAHLENRISGKIGNYFRRTSANTASKDDYVVNGTNYSNSRQPHQQSHRRHVKSTSSLVDLNMDVLDDLCLPLSMSPTVEQHVTADDEDVSSRNINDDPDFSARTSPAKLDSPSTPVGILDGENWSLLQALDLLPDDDLHELLQGKTSGGSTNCINGAFTGPPLFNGGSGNTPTLSNGSSNGGIGGDGCLRSNDGINGNRSHQHSQQQQTPMMISSSSDSEASSSAFGVQSPQRRGIGGLVKRQRNSLTCLDGFPRGVGQEEMVALSRARSTQLRSKKETPPANIQQPLPPNTLPSASQLLFQNKSMNSHAASTEDLFHLPELWQQQNPHHQFPPRNSPHYQRSDSTFTWQDKGRGGATSHFPLPAYHLSDTEMPSQPPLSTSHHHLPAPPHPRRVANRLKRRRRAFGERFYTFDSRYLPPQSTSTLQPQQ
nr:zinc finger C2H2 type [Hymenolepis microstoma]